jgi:hypothetical protein
MAKNSIPDFSATAASNTDIQSVNIDENCPASGINNAIRELMVDLKNVDTGAVALTSPQFATASMTGDLTLGDNDKAVFGAGSDLQISHTGAYSLIADSGTGNLILACEDFALTNPAVGENMITAAVDGAVTLFHDNSAKIATTSSGVNVSGIATIQSDSPELHFIDSTNSTDAIIRSNNNGDIVLEADENAERDNTIIRFDVDASEKMRITSGGNVGIGTASPSVALDVQTTASDAFYVTGGRSVFTTESNGNGVVINGIGTPANYYFDIRDDGATGVFRVDPSGNVLIGKTASNFSTDGIEIAPGGQILATATNAECFFFDRSNDGKIGKFFRNGAEKGSIQVSSSGTAYNTSSDYRLKENVTGIANATDRLKQLNPVRFNFISDADTTVDGFLAHEVSDIVPEAISGEKDAMKDEQYEVSAATGDIYTPATDDTDEVIHSSNAEQPEELADGQRWRETTPAEMGTRTVPDYQGIDQSKLVPLLVATIQELEARIAALEA